MKTRIYTREDIDWAKKIIRQLNDFDRMSLESNNVFQKYKKRFGNDPTYDALRSWFGRIKPSSSSKSTSYKSKYSESDTQWAKEIIENLDNMSGKNKIQNFGVLEKYEKKFGRKISLTGLKSWFQRITSSENMRKKNYDNKRKDSIWDPKVISWSKNIIQKKLKNKVTPSSILNADILKEFNKKFNRHISLSGLYGRLRKVQNGRVSNKEDNPSKRQQEELVSGSQYIISVPSMKKFYGFETLKEVQQFLKDNLLIAMNNICIYERKIYRVQCDFKIS
jgi:hypothetical protein